LPGAGIWESCPFYSLPPFILWVILWHNMQVYHFTKVLLTFQVTTIQSCSQGMNKVLVSLQQKFPSVPKSLMKNKVREVADYVDNRLQVSLVEISQSSN